jgi:hypothetical protein
MKHMRLLLGLLMLLTLAGAVNATTKVVSGAGVQFGSGLSIDNNEVAWTYPANGGTVYNPASFLHNLTCSNTFWKYTTTIWNSSGAIYYSDTLSGGLPPTSCGSFAPNTNFTTNFNDPTLPPAGSAGWPYINLPQDTYTIQTYTQTAAGPTYTYSPNLTFMVSAYVTNTTSTGGNCITPKGYGMSYTAAISWTHVLFNLTQLAPYLENVNSSNVWTDPGIPIYTNGTDIIIVNTTGTKTFTLWIGGFDTNNVYPQVALTPSHNDTLTLSNFTQANPSYLLNIYNESSGAPWLTATPVLSNNITVLCNDHAPNTVDVKTLGLNYLIIFTKELPTFVGQMSFWGVLNTTIQNPYTVTQVNTYNNATWASSNNTAYVIQNTTYLVNQSVIRQKRVWQPMNINDNGSIYYLTNQSTIQTVDFNLNDYTGQWQDSYLQVYRNINATLQLVYQQKWYNIMVLGGTFEDNGWYEYVLNKNGQTKVIQWDQITGAYSNKTISVNAYSYSNPKTFDNTLTVGMTSSYVGSTVGVAWNGSEALSTVTFAVYNQTGTGSNYQLIKEYEVNQTLPPANGVLSYTVQNQNKTYLVELKVNKPSGAAYSYQSYVNPQYYSPSAQPLSQLLNMPTGILGYTTQNSLTFGVVFLVSMTAMMFGAISFLFGLLMTVAIVGASYYFGLAPWITFPLFLFMFSIGLLDQYISKRKQT